MEALSQNDSSPKSYRLSAKVIPALLFQFPDIHPTKGLFTKEKLPDGIIIPPVATDYSLNMSRPSAKKAVLLV
jgi:hypothetical protein